MLGSKITGIIAEFNPLHKGHELLIKKQKENNSACVVLLSSSFTQRGEPAFIDKFLRAEMAIKAGADLVLELKKIPTIKIFYVKNFLAELHLAKLIQ